MKSWKKPACISAALWITFFSMSMNALLVNASEQVGHDEGLQAIMAGSDSGSPPLAGLQVLVLRDGEVAYEFAGGFARRNNGQTIPLDLEHKVRVASISKLVVAVGLMRLVEAGKVDLDRGVSDYLGFALRNPNFPDDAITLRRILSHTSSVRDGGYYWLESGSRFEDFFLQGHEHYDNGAHFAAGEGRQPGRYFSYSNLNFGIVAAVIERVSGQRFDAYMRQNVLQPLGLQASYNVCDLSASQPEQVATLWRKRNSEEVWQPEKDWVPQLDDETFSCHYGREPVARGENPGDVLPGYAMGENPTLFSPQGGLRASARDLSVIARMLMAGGQYNGVRILAAETVRQMFTAEWRFDPALNNGDTSEVADPNDPEPDHLFTAYGLSVHLADLREWDLAERSRTLYGHLGEAYGLLGLFWMDPDNGDALIALITGSGDDPGKHPGVSPLSRPEEEIMRWWLRYFPR